MKRHGWPSWHPDRLLSVPVSRRTSRRCPAASRNVLRHTRHRSIAARRPRPCSARSSARVPTYTQRRARCSPVPAVAPRQTPRRSIRVTPCIHIASDKSPFLVPVQDHVQHLTPIRPGCASRGLPAAMPILAHIGASQCDKIRGIPVESGIPFRNQCNRRRVVPCPKTRVLKEPW